jgi:hypothetical protein
MRATLVSMLAVLAQWAIPANGQLQTGALPSSPAANNGYFAHPPARRLFFFASDPKLTGAPALFGQPAQARGTTGFLWPYSFTAPVSRNPAHPTLKLTPAGLLPLESPPPRLWLLRSKNSRLFFFSKP